MTDLVIRPLAAGEEDLFDRLPDPELVGAGAFGSHYSDPGMRGQYRPEWTWVALRGDTVVARTAWWAGPEDPEPLALDWFDFAEPDTDVAVELLRTAPYRVEYSLRLPPGWRDDPTTFTEGNRRITAAETAGMTQLVERYRYRWTSECGLPKRSDRLVFRPEQDENVLFDVFRRIVVGSLDAHERQLLETEGPDAAAKDELDFLRWMPRGRDLWRLAYTPDGELVGIAVPGYNHSAPVVGFIGVVPEHRGHGYAYDLLAETTHLLAADGADEVVAATDLPNRPMAATFAKAGYPVVEHRLDLTWPTA